MNNPFIDFCRGQLDRGTALYWHGGWEAADEFTRLRDPIEGYYRLILNGPYFAEDEGQGIWRVTISEALQRCYEIAGSIGMIECHDGEWESYPLDWEQQRALAQHLAVLMVRCCNQETIKEKEAA